MKKETPQRHKEFLEEFDRLRSDPTIRDTEWLNLYIRQANTKWERFCKQWFKDCERANVPVSRMFKRDMLSSSHEDKMIRLEAMIVAEKMNSLDDPHAVLDFIEIQRQRKGDTTHA